MNVNHHNPGSAHAMMVNNVMQGQHTMGGINMSGHHSAMEMHSTIQNRANMLGGQGGLLGAGGN